MISKDEEIAKRKEKAIEKIKEFERFGSILGLERISELMERLGNPQNQLRCIHIAGTNGKGSVSKYIYEGLRANNYKVGLYTSPFLEIFNERIEFDGSYISDIELASCTERVLEKVDEMIKDGFDSPTEFEVTTAVAFLYFKEKNSDYVVLEVGLGGRGDSTNVIEKPIITVITSISYDHMDRLGNTLAEIAWEKAGIIKEGIPVVINVKDKEAASVIAREAYDKNAVLCDVRKYKYGNLRQDISGTAFDTIIDETGYMDVEISMLGDHQIENAMTALTAIEIMRKALQIKVERSMLYKGILSAKQIGRFEIIKKDPYVILDGAHNEAGAKALAAVMKQHFGGKKVLIVCGVLKDKAVFEMLDSFCSIADDFVATEPAGDRKLDSSILNGYIVDRGKMSIEIPNRQDACRYVEDNMDKYDVILFAGSLYLIGEIRGILRNGFCK